jgi:signal transduction histidine kinase
MAKSALLLLDPTGQLRAESEALQSRCFHQHETAEAFLDELAHQKAAAVCVVDVRALDSDDCERLRNADCSCLAFGVVIVDSADIGREWLAAGATDFVVLAERADELDARIDAAITICDRCQAPRHVAAAHQAGVNELVHELKNPLNAISGYTELLLMEDGLSEQAKVDLGRILSNANDLESKIEAVSRGDTTASKNVEDARTLEAETS